MDPPLLENSGYGASVFNEHAAEDMFTHRRSDPQLTYGGDAQGADVFGASPSSGSHDDDDSGGAAEWGNMGPDGLGLDLQRLGEGPPDFLPDIDELGMLNDDDLRVLDGI